ncbi:ABC transporter ATP-binding protein [Pseudoalteromonas sp. OANN1]|uniref:ABC transporter ATP-binding protein n=1 Tax=Pseudoalteromonas sp. OANN1 TaxID=2954497 RepID=UPI002096EC95|nr:ABC transporter ATP-binding protein [Pseudoalteromonas sp. OANN1]
MKELIKLTGLNKVFSTDEVDTHALANIDMVIEAGEYVSLSGPSGCGKSTLLSVLGLLDTHTSGQYHLNGHDVTDLDSSQRAHIRNKEVGFIFQSFNLISELTVAENVALPLTYRQDISKADREKKVASALEKVDMLHRAKHHPSQLSGGQQQRVAIARAIVGEPSILLADEPTGNLDSKNAELVMDLLDKLHKEGATICMVTHDPRGAERAQRVIHILDGKLVTDEQVLEQQYA